MDEASQKVLDQIEKLFRVAGKTSNEAEATAFTAKANALMAAHNLTMSEVEQNSTEAVSGRRLDEQVMGGMYTYQKNLWRNIAELNFCMYFTLLVKTEPGTKKFRRGRKFTNAHRVVGRQVNVAATKALASYLNSTIERHCRARLQDRTDLIVKGNNQFYSSWAVAFREGMADRIIEKIQERRGDVLAKEDAAARKAAREAAKKGLSTATAVSLRSIADQEKIKNYDFIHGEGAWARKEAEKAERDKNWAEWRAECAKEEAEAEAAYSEWAKAHPEEAAAEERKALAKERARERQRARRGGGWGRSYFAESKSDSRRRSGGYLAGQEAGASVGIDLQADQASVKRLR